MNGLGASCGTAIIRSPLLALAPARPPDADLLATLLREQQSLSAVERFSQLHERDAPPAQARYYRDLIPSARPGAGQQYAFEVDLESCTGCKACVSACHSLNGLDDGESFRAVGLIHGGAPGNAFSQTVTSACHHCVDPACMNGCPVNAYEKDPVTGIVKHLDDQCIGCQYCTLMCPYDAPKYNSARGIVRKCDMCSDRLASAEAPACVQACPNQAIRIEIVDQRHAIQASEAGTFLAGAPGPEDTIPTTVFRSSRPVPVNVLPADFYSVSPEHSHPPLVVMLVLTQMAVGSFSLSWWVDRFGFTATAAMPRALFALGMAVAALAVSALHLGRPLYAFRAVLGLRRSWLSREIVTFGLFAPLGALYAFLSAPDLHRWLLSGFAASDIVRWREIVGVAAIVAGALGILSSVMVYAATRRAPWNGPATAFRFVGTALVTGGAAVYVLGVVSSPGDVAATFVQSAPARALLWLVLIATGMKLLAEGLRLRHRFDRRTTALKRVAVLMTGELRQATGFRLLAAGLGGLLFVGILLALTARENFHPEQATLRAGLAIAIFVLLLSGEFLERMLFFKAAPGSRMPGGLA